MLEEVYFSLYILVPPSPHISPSARPLHTTDRAVSCLSGYSRPKSSLKWYRNGRLLNVQNDTRGFTISESLVATTVTGGSDLFLVDSVLTMASDWYKNLDVLTCQASTGVDTVVDTLILSEPGNL